jgi:hypothetical protein
MFGEPTLDAGRQRGFQVLCEGANTMCTRFRALSAIFLLCSLAAATAVAQTKPQVSQKAKDIFYNPQTAVLPGQEQPTGPGQPGETPTPAEPPEGAVLGLHYWILLRQADGKVKAVTDQHEFQQGDKFRLKFDTNAEGYAYVFHRGSSKRGTVLFPDERINEGKNLVPKHKEYTVPPTGWFEFDETPGTEELFVFFSTKPLKELERSAAARSIEERTWSRSIGRVIERHTRLVKTGRTRDIVYVEEGESIMPGPTPPTEEVQPATPDEDEPEEPAEEPAEEPGEEAPVQPPVELEAPAGAQPATPPATQPAGSSQPGTYVCSLTTGGQGLLIHTIKLTHE